MPDLAKCGACGRLVRWATTARRGKAIPLDPEPSLAGNAYFDASGLVHILGRQTDLFGDAPPVRYVPHHATCPSWRGREKDPRDALARTESAAAAQAQAAEGAPVAPALEAELQQLAPRLYQATRRP